MTRWNGRPGSISGTGVHVQATEPPLTAAGRASASRPRRLLPVSVTVRITRSVLGGVLRRRDQLPEHPVRRALGADRPVSSRSAWLIGCWLIDPSGPDDGEQAGCRITHRTEEVPLGLQRQLGPLSVAHVADDHVVVDSPLDTTSCLEVHATRRPARARTRAPAPRGSRTPVPPPRRTVPRPPAAGRARTPSSRSTAPAPPASPGSDRPSECRRNGGPCRATLKMLSGIPSSNARLRSSLARSASSWWTRTVRSRPATR